MANRFPSKETVARLREQYPAGTRIELISMNDPYSSLKPGDRGSVTFIDDTGTIFASWDKGSGLGIVYGEDSCRKVTENIYETGADFFRDTAVNHGMDEALGICGRYLGTQLRLEQPPDEIQFCRELFEAMYEASAEKTDPTKIVYPYDFKTASDRVESSYYHESRKLNAECAGAIDETIRASCYKPNYYNLEIAAMKAAHDYGFARVNLVLAHNFQKRQHDGRFSDVSKRWAQGFSVAEQAFSGAVLNAHPILIEDFAKHVRKLYDAVGAERFALPGRPEHGEDVHGYQIIRSIEFDDRRGFAIAHSPTAVDPFVCWQFTTENGKRDYYWGAYGSEKSAADNYQARVIVHMSGGDAKEIPNHLAAAEMTVEQNYNMIDGQINNEPTKNNASTEASGPSDAEREFAMWRAVTESSRFTWTEDEIYRLNGRGAMYYIGGEDGLYMRIGQDGALTIGEYEGAVPHIGEALFRVSVHKQFDNYSDAFAAAMEAGGKKFLADMFSAGHHIAAEESARRAFESGVFSPERPIAAQPAVDEPAEKPSVMKQIRDAQKAPKPPRKVKAPDKQKGRDEAEL